MSPAKPRRPRQPAKPALAGGVVASVVPLADIQPYHRNPRLNTDAVAKVSASIREFGFRQPIVVDRHGVIIAGHTRFLAATALGLQGVPVIRAADLTPQQVRAYRIADNRTAQQATWDPDLLRGELDELRVDGFDLALTGFDAPEIEDLFGTGSGITPGADPDEAPAVPAKPTTTTGDVIELGRHRLTCGDATDPAAWMRLMREDQAAAVWTDPPYGVDYAGKNRMLNAADKGNRVQTPIENDSIAPDQLADLLGAAFDLAIMYSAAGAAWYVASPAGPLNHVFATELLRLEVWRHTLIWLKDGMVLGRADYHYRHEPIFYGWKPGGPHLWLGGRSQNTVLDFPKPRRSDLHPTMKPVALVQRCLENSSHPGAIVVDPFGGSGTTLVAAEACGRSARLIELSPSYCDVIVKRWEDLTGQQAILV